MRLSKIHKIMVTAVATTIATATLLTFTRGDSATADRIASLPETGNDAPRVAVRTPGATTKPTPTPSATTPSPEDEPVAQPPKPTVKPSKTTKPPAPTTKPAPSPTPTQKNLLEILLGQ